MEKGIRERRPYSAVSMNRCSVTGDIKSFVPPYLPAKSNPAVGIGLASRLEVGGEAEQGGAPPPRTSY